MQSIFAAIDWDCVLMVAAYLFQSFIFSEKLGHLQNDPVSLSIGGAKYHWFYRKQRFNNSMKCDPVKKRTPQQYIHEGGMRYHKIFKGSKRPIPTKMLGIIIAFVVIALLPGNRLSLTMKVDDQCRIYLFSSLEEPSQYFHSNQALTPFTLHTVSLFSLLILPTLHPRFILFMRLADICQCLMHTFFYIIIIIFYLL